MHRKSQALVSALVLFIGIASFYVSGCARNPTVNQRQTAASPSPSPSPITITTSELVKLRWIEGTWRGTGVDQPPFYERYTFENDSTLVVEGLADETLSKVNDTSRFELKDGHFGHTEGESGSVATALDDNSISFAPVGKGNYFRFQRESENSWKAILNWTGKDGTPKERIYNMERISAAKK
jgi:hypothetical protein